MLDGRASAGASVDSARQNLAATFVNAFVNAGFGQVCVHRAAYVHVWKFSDDECLLLLIALFFLYRIS